MTRRHLLVCSLSLLVLSVFRASANCALARDNALGSELYTNSCAVCHGTGRLGGGEFVKALTVKPSNVTSLSARNDGVFPFLDVFHFIDGRHRPL